TAIFSLFLNDEIESLEGVVLPVELCYTGIGVGLVIAEFFFRLALAIARSDKVIPIFELIHGFAVGCRFHESRSDLRNGLIMRLRRLLNNGILTHPMHAKEKSKPAPLEIKVRHPFKRSC